MNVALIGYGEVGRILAEDLRVEWLTAFDVKLDLAAGASMREHAREQGVALCASHADAVREADLVVSAVTAHQTVAAARDTAGGLKSGAFFLDLNSASPGAKIAAARDVMAHDGRYVEGAVMTSVPPHRIKMPLLLGGPDAAELEPLLRGLGFEPNVYSGRLGVASATKMCRSVIIKGLEALVIESFTAARHYGVEEAVLASLHETFPGVDWERQGAYCFQRVIEHGRRRGEEMREVAVTVRDAGLEPLLATAAAERQAFIADLVDRGVFGPPGGEGFARSADFRIEVDRLLAGVAPAKGA
jgi:3-hydroxyisobutyrate dehydrogenase-like beta-hydroxyacid dehydrogenase